VAQALGQGFLDRKHEVMLSSRSPEKLEDWNAGSFEEAAAFGELIVLAAKGTETESVLGSAGRENLGGKVLIDVTNPLVFEGDIPRLAYGPTDSGGEVVQRTAAEAKVVKTLNIVNAGQMVDPEAEDGPPTMFVAGEDEGAKRTVTELLESFGWSDVVDIGGIDASRELESLCVLWCRYAIPNQGWQATFRLLR
jgi:predicted dinucleotide-binding enzyme